MAENSGTDKAYLSKLEKDLKDVRVSTLKRIVEDAPGAKPSINIVL